MSKTELSLNTLYKVTRVGDGAAKTVAPCLEVIGTVNVYGALDQSVTPTPPDNMSLDAADFTGIAPFGVMPSYLYLTGTATRITISGFDVVEVPT